MMTSVGLVNNAVLHVINGMPGELLCVGQTWLVLPLHYVPHNVLVLLLCADNLSAILAWISWLYRRHKKEG